MSDTVKCACPRVDARECFEVRHGLDLRYLLNDGTDDVEDGLCECGCHEEYERENAYDDEELDQ